MEPDNNNTPLEKENHLPNPHFQVRAVNLWGCMFYFVGRLSGSMA